jgi:hypothetical protein
VEVADPPSTATLTSGKGPVLIIAHNAAEHGGLGIGQKGKKQQQEQKNTSHAGFSVGRQGNMRWPK